MTETMGPMGCYMEGMGLKFTPAIGRRLLRHSSMFAPMAGTSETDSWLKQSQWKV